MDAVVTLTALLQLPLALCRKIGFVSVSPIFTSFALFQFLSAFFSGHSGSFPLTTLYLSDSQSYCRFWEEELERGL